MRPVTPAGAPLAKTREVRYAERVSIRERIRFYQQISVLVRAGVPIRGSLERLKDRISARELKVLSAKVNAGERLGDAFVAAGFSRFECDLVAAGERSASLDAMFEHLALYWSRERDLRGALIRPLIYPIVLMHLVIIVSAVVDAFSSSMNEAIAHFIVRLALFYVAGAFIYLVVRGSWSSESLRRFWLFVPLVGGSLAATYSYRWIAALRLQFIAGVTLSRAVADAWRVSGYSGSEARAQESEQSIRQGIELSKLMHGWRQLPRDWVDFIETGELSGKLENAFTELEAEAGRNWKIAHERLSEWAPKIAYFVVLVFVAFQVASLMYKVEVAPMVEVQKEIDDASRH